MTEVLWLTPVPPDRGGGGGHVRQAHLLAALAERSAVHLVCAGRVRDPAVRSAAASVVELGVEEVDWSRLPTWRRRAADVRLAFGSVPREVAAFAPVARAMEAEVARAAAEVVVVEYAGLAPLVAHRRAGQRWVLTMHNVLSVMASQQAAAETGRRQRWLYSRDARIARRWERRLLPRYDRVIAVSGDDSSALGGSAAVVPNGVDTAKFRPAALPPDPSVVFTGALYTGPNQDGIGWFCREVWPRVRDMVPGATLAVVGARPPDEVSRLASLSGVSVHADVEDTYPYIAAARVAVVPLRVGSGTRLKALEAMSCARPVVGTTVGLAGLGLVDGRHAAFADDPRGFAAAVRRALEDDTWAASLGAEGRRLVEARFDWQAIGRRFADVILDAGD
ncbi:MAG TPA: glycosyltransferase [Acidobacteriaceae bacterium]|nr:glycosyltransferase [Acidobacteriaceae bacterium]